MFFYFQCVRVLIKILLEIAMQKARQISWAVTCAAGRTGELTKPMEVLPRARPSERAACKLIADLRTECMLSCERFLPYLPAWSTALYLIISENHTGSRRSHADHSFCYGSYCHGNSESFPSSVSSLDALPTCMWPSLQIPCNRNSRD